MITLKITKDKYIAIINGITGITQKMRDDLKIMEHDMNRAQTNAHLDVWEDLSRKMRSKVVMMEKKPGNHKVNFSVNGIEALLFVVYRKACYQEPYIMATLQEISDPIFQRLLQ